MAYTFLAPVDFTKNELQNPRLQNLASAPASPATGQFYWDTTLTVWRVWDGSTWVSFGSGSGSVTSVALSMPGVFSVAGSPITTSGTLAVTLASQSQNLVWASPNGSSGTPTFRALAQADIPNSITLNYWAAPTTSLSMGSQKITNLLDPTGAQDAATKNYVDSVAQGLDVKGSVRVATTGNGTLATAFANGQTVDGVVLATNDRILIKNQSTAAENGIYTVNASGAPTRAIDFDAWAEVPGAFTFVELGTANAESGWVCTSDQGGTLGSTAVNFAQFSGAGQITAGAGMTKTGNTLDIVAADTSILVGADNFQVNLNATASGLEVSSGLRIKSDTATANTIGVTIVANGAGVKIDANSFADGGSETLALASGVAGNGLALTSGVLSVNVDNSTVELNADALRVKDAGITFAKIASGVWGSSLDTTGSVVNVKGYTWVSGATVARLVSSAQTLATGSFSNVVTHNLGSQNVIVQVRDTTSNDLIVTEVDYTSTNTVTVSGVNNTGGSISASVIVCG